jgi:hypothetical protein
MISTLTSLPTFEQVMQLYDDNTLLQRRAIDTQPAALEGLEGEKVVM